MTHTREFSTEYLEQAGRPTVDLINDAVTAGGYGAIAGLVEQFHTEVCSMLYGYLIWPKCTARHLKARGEEGGWMEMEARVRELLDSDLPPARQVFPGWEATRDKLLAATEQRGPAEIIGISQQWHKEALAIHDSYMNYAAIMASELARRYGADTMQAVFTEIMDPGVMAMEPTTPFRQRVETLIKFTRLHLLPFRLVEDDEKMTFIASPCPSGGRQILAGLYEPGKPGEIIRGESPITYSRARLPAYCCHESALEAASIQRFGSPLFIVEPSQRLGHLPCHVHVYKNPQTIPDRYYRRVGMGRENDLIVID